MSAAEELRKLLASNPELAIDFEQSDPGLQRLTAVPGQKGEDKERGPESELEERLSAYLAALNFPPPVFGFRFNEGRRWRFDLAWPDDKIAIEVEGGLYGVGPACPTCGRRAAGGHTSIEGFTSDREKYNTAQAQGWIVLSVTSKQINNGQAAYFLQKALNYRMDQEGDHNEQ